MRVVHSWFASSDDWDGQFEGHAYGWVMFFRILRLALTHFRGPPGLSFQVMGVAPEPKAEAWRALTDALGLGGAAVGERRRAPAGAPPLAGMVERTGPAEYPEELILRLDEPAPGLAHLFAMSMAGQVYLPIPCYLYGEQAPAALACAEPAWQVWIGERFAPAEASPGGA